MRCEEKGRRKMAGKMRKTFRHYNFFFWKTYFTFENRNYIFNSASGQRKKVGKTFYWNRKLELVSRVIKISKHFFFILHFFPFFVFYWKNSSFAWRTIDILVSEQCEFINYPQPPAPQPLNAHHFFDDKSKVFFFLLFLFVIKSFFYFFPPPYIVFAIYL